MRNQEDIFGIMREKRISASRVREVFTPHTPINSVSLFRGRSKQVAQLIEQMNTPGQHALLYGDRGVGKTSLANIVADLLSTLAGGRLYRHRCTASDTFATIVEKPMRGVGMDLDAISATHRVLTQVDGKVDAVMLKGGTMRENETLETVNMGIVLRPAVVADAVYEHEALFVIDEADAIRDPVDQRKLAELIKLLSDMGSKLKVLVVGIAETGSSLMAEHPSVQRCLKETKLDRMSETELSEIIDLGATELGLTFESSIIRRIAKVGTCQRL